MGVECVCKTENNIIIRKKANHQTCSRCNLHQVLQHNEQFEG